MAGRKPKRASNEAHGRRAPEPSPPDTPPAPAAPPVARRLHVLIVDDHPIVREGVRRRVESQSDMDVCFETGNAAQALAWLVHESCDFAIVDLSLEGRSGLDLIKDIRARGLAFPIMVLSVHDDMTYAERALAAGAQGYVLKEEGPTQIVDGMRRILAGEVFVSERMASKLLTHLAAHRPSGSPGNPASALSDRELAVLEAVGRGRGTRQIARGLSLSVSTIETYKSRIKEKLGLATAAELTAFASRWLLGQSPPPSAPPAPRRS